MTSYPESESESESEPTSSPESESESEQHHPDSAPLAKSNFVVISFFF